MECSKMARWNVVILFMAVFILCDQRWGCLSTAAHGSCVVRRDDDSCGGLLVNCSGQNLSQIPSDLPRMTRCLHLDHNNISQISHELNAYPDLQVFSITGNALSLIAKGAFTSLVKLEVLFIDSNKLVFNDSFPNATFYSFEQVKTLHMQNNSWESVDHYKHDLFVNMQSLEELHIDGLPSGQGFGLSTKHLSSLQSLTIYGGIDYVSNETFAAFSEVPLQALCIHSGRLYDLDAMAFGHFSQLKSLSLNDNPKLGFVNMSHGWYGLAYTQIQNLFLQRTVPLEDEPIILNSTFYNNLNHTSIKTLFIDKNNIIFIKPSSFSQYLPQLELLSLEYNRLQSINAFVIDLYYTRNLRHILASHQSRRSPPDSELGCYPTSTLDALGYSTLGSTALVDQQPSHVIGNWSEVTSSQSMNMKSEDWFWKWSKKWFIPAPRSVEYYSTSGVMDYVLDTIPFLVILGPNNLRYVDLSSNGFKSMSGPFYVGSPNNNSVTFVLAYNEISYVNPTILDESIKAGLIVGDIDMTGNHLGPQLGRDSTVLRAYKDLQHLNLSANIIKTLPKNIFASLKELVTLNLSHNSLQSINFTLEHFTKLKFLDLSFNLLTYLDARAASKLDEMALNFQPNLTINIYQNPLECSCQKLQFLVWLQTSQVLFQELENYQCVFNDSLVNIVHTFEHTLSKFRQHCMSYEYLIIASIAITLVMLGTLASIIVYRHRWDIKFCCLQLVSQRKKQQQLTEERTFKYDAFVAYHIKDVRWVKDVLIPGLETPADHGDTHSLNRNQGSVSSFKLCVHHRDFMPGSVIEENIIESINQSYKTLLVLSKNFVTSQWCEFELQMARMKCFDKGRDIIVVVMLEPVPVACMSKTLRALIRRTTYIQWPENRTELPEFWRKLRGVLRAAEVSPVTCECGRYMRDRS